MKVGIQDLYNQMPKKLLVAVWIVISCAPSHTVDDIFGSGMMRYLQKNAFRPRLKFTKIKGKEKVPDLAWSVSYLLAFK